MESKVEKYAERELRKFQGLYELAVAMTIEGSLEDCLRLVVEKSRKLLETDTAYIALRDEVRGEVYMYTLTGIRTEAFRTMRLPFGQGLGGLVAKTRKGLVVEDYLGEKTIEHVVDKVVTDEGLVSGMAVPVQMGDANLGVLYVFNRTKTIFSQSDLDTLSLIGNLAAVQISRKRAEERARKSQEQLEEKVRERTHELMKANEVLEQELLERKRAEEALRESEHRYRSLVENLPIGIYRVTPGERGRFLMANPAFLSMFGYESEEEVKGLHVSDIYMRPAERKVFSDDLLAMKSVTVSDRYLKRKDGTTLWGRVTARVVCEEGKEEAFYFDCAIEDITEKKLSEQALLESERKYRDLFDNVSDFIYFHDLEGNFQEMNSSFQRAAGLNEQTWRGLNVREMVPVDNRSLIDEYLRRIKEKGQDEGLLKILNREGKEVIIEYRNTLVFDQAGRPTGIRGSGRDVTERIRTEREKGRLQAQLMSAQRIEAVGTLAGGIAHNFNNLLMGIQGNATLAKLEMGPSSPIYSKLESIEKLVRSGAKLTSQLLGYAREGRYEVKPIGLNALVKETSHTFAQARKDLTVSLELEETLSGIEADQGQIEQVLLNLLVNAADAMPSGGRVFLRTRNITHQGMVGKPYRAKPGKYVLLEVEDTGVGMDPKTQARIFEPFFTTKGLGKGTGLGLASVYGIVKGHGGYIDVVSEKGKGARFLVYLPASEREAIKERELATRVMTGSEGILLVDDEEMILEVGRAMLEKLGYRVFAAGSGQEAVRVYRKERDAIDLVVLDMIMPEMGGGETFDRLKQIDPDVKVLLSSGYSIDGQAKEILDRGCGGFIQKPFHLQELSQELRRVLGRTH